MIKQTLIYGIPSREGDALRRHLELQGFSYFDFTGRKLSEDEISPTVHAYIARKKTTNVQMIPLFRGTSDGWKLTVPSACDELNKAILQYMSSQQPQPTSN